MNTQLLKYMWSPSSAVTLTLHPPDISGFGGTGRTTRCTRPRSARANRRPHALSVNFLTKALAHTRAAGEPRAVIRNCCRDHAAVFAPMSWRSQLTNLLRVSIDFPNQDIAASKWVLPTEVTSKSRNSVQQLNEADPNSGDFKRFVFRVGEETLY